ncbi:hypothetical protein HZC53_01230 [Candidatus Uhrbacteria bacterium]|nr:hypothetical protein [Candidatus Uhrbacteria bacterium]
MHLFGSDKCEMGGCKCPHHKVVPVLITFIGVLFLFKAVGYLSASSVDLAWPVLLIIIGLQKTFGSMCRCCCQK